MKSNAFAFSQYWISHTNMSNSASFAPISILKPVLSFSHCALQLFISCFFFVKKNFFFTYGKKKKWKKKWKWLKERNFFGWNFFFEKIIFYVHFFVFVRPTYKWTCIPNISQNRKLCKILNSINQLIIWMWACDMHRGRID